MQGQPLFSRRTEATEAAAQAERDNMPAGALASYRERARKDIDRIDRTLEPLGTLPDRKEYLTKRYLTLGRIAKGDEIAKAVGKAFGNTTAADKQAVFDYLTTKAASPKSIQNELARADAVRAKNLIESVSDAMVARGMLSEEARETHRGSYLPQLYLKWLLNDADVKALGAGKKPSDMGYLKGRKIERTKGPDGEMRLAWRETGKPLSDAQVLDLGPITDPGFLAATAIAKPVRDMALLDFLSQISQNEKWILENNLVDFEGVRSTPQFLKVEADRLRRQVTLRRRTPRRPAPWPTVWMPPPTRLLAPWRDFKNYREVQIPQSMAACAACGVPGDLRRPCGRLQPERRTRASCKPAGLRWYRHQDHAAVENGQGIAQPASPDPQFRQQRRAVTVVRRIAAQGSGIPDQSRA